VIEKMQTWTAAAVRQRRRPVWPALLLCLPVVLAIAIIIPFRYAYEPSRDRGLNTKMSHPVPAYDLWGQSIGPEEASRKLATPEGRADLSAAHGAVAVDDELLSLGRTAFYTETFGNEIFLTDVLGIVDGPLTLTAFARALLQLGGKGTTNLQVVLPHEATVGGRFFPQGTVIDTGIDVPRGAYAPLGLAIKKVGASIKVGITCAACHSTLDPVSFEIVHGAPNNDLNAGWILAMASNSASFFVHADITSLDGFVTDDSATVRDSAGRLVKLPYPQALEDAVDAALLRWPKGNFDSMVDLVAAPTQIPSSFTFEAYPYNFSGGFAAGPFHGLSVQNNNVHALNSDGLTHVGASPMLFGIDSEVYLATVLQNAASSHYRYDPGSGRKPSEFFASIDPTPDAPALNEMVEMPTYPNATLIAPDGFWNSSRGRPIWQQVNAMSAWQNTLIPAPPPFAPGPAALARGKAAFQRAGCASCHLGSAYTNHRIVPIEEIRTEPARAAALRRTGATLVPPVAIAFDQKVPLPPQPRTIPVPTGDLDPEQIRLAFALDGSAGGYKVPGLLGLYWTAPYLHDGGVAVGERWESELGMPGTLAKGILPDPRQSLRALLDRTLRARVVAANDADADMRSMHVRGIGHEYWVDGAAGFDSSDQSALLDYLLTLTASNVRE
jgi:hypothetical protein